MDKGRSDYRCQAAAKPAEYRLVVVAAMAVSARRGSALWASPIGSRCVGGRVISAMQSVARDYQEQALAPRAHLKRQGTNHAPSSPSLPCSSPLSVHPGP